MRPPYNPIRQFLYFVERLGKKIEDMLWEIEDMTYEDQKKIYVYADYVNNSIGFCKEGSLPTYFPSKKVIRFRNEIGKYAEDGDLVNWSQLIEFASLTIPEGEYALHEYTKGFESYSERISKPYNTIEDTWYYRSIVDKVNAVSEELTSLRESSGNSDEIYQSIKKVILKEKYNLDWKTDNELSVGIEFPFSEFCFDYNQIKANPEFKECAKKVFDILNELYREDMKSLFCKPAAYATCERVMQILFAVKYIPPSKRHNNNL